ncbi:AraC family transcriptional regulator [Cyclobacterium qasimii]|uniref:Transcriptional regulator of various polyols utilization, AraC family n=2 Tax=Cyclobacterium qasimii TaxID=1350429 RepID=S7VG09_9BACT|nr:AraC family transcriptional regulator [Cyclobacterium qasimii]EPR69135.1 Transcriptional regulator of various polyols utilization, AraC family [Cyclobacterium qasimii M12-11B]GEO22530.1 AraC family transcriptional regulator [Cyclobacterium qasimii]
MKPHFHKIPSTSQHSFSIRYDKKPNFGTLWHFHPELELHHIIKGQGTQFIGDTVKSFSDGDLILLGENLPHTWRCTDEYFQGKADVEVEAYVLQFLPTCFGKDFLEIPETQSISSLFEIAKKGMIIYGNTKKKLIEILHKTINASQLDRVINLLRMIQILAATSEYETISPGYANRQLANITEMEKLEKIYAYVLSHYRDEISLEKIAAIANLSVSTFSRYFKKMTNKTFFEFLIEIRISNACRALIKDKLPIEVICYDCGFNNVSNFYRHFNKVIGMTPYAYKKQYLF